MAALDELALEVATHAVEHLELEPVGTDAAPLRRTRHRLDHRRVVGRDRGVGVGLEERDDQVDERGVDRHPVVPRDRLRLRVGALADADPHAIAGEALHVAAPSDAGTPG